MTLNELGTQWTPEDRFHTRDGIDMEVTREGLLTMQVCADSPDGEAVAEAISAIRPPGTMANRWVYADGEHGWVRSLCDSPTVECEDHEGRFHHLMYC